MQQRILDTVWRGETSFKFKEDDRHARTGTKSSAGTDTTVGACAPRTLNRRAFLGRASLSSVALLLAPEFANGAAFPVAITVLPSPATFAHFQPLVPGHVRPPLTEIAAYLKEFSTQEFGRPFSNCDES